MRKTSEWVIYYRHLISGITFYDGTILTLSSKNDIVLIQKENTAHIVCTVFQQDRSTPSRSDLIYSFLNKISRIGSCSIPYSSCDIRYRYCTDHRP